ncbi:hypothetical protein BDU57DRAFT_564706 [Ampelomyces quisqualis]|uniref:Uncharacterized protein n=1 Tax=Ampelomyces quisqualis TaxID=50730 RepID=A0A6A5Q9G4_AMPQU|nr:hypothetical protein BDU57DRAFT_564706 [Ampelomyces quisqualis]
MAPISKPSTSLGLALDGLFDLARRRASSQQSSEQVINQLTSGLPEVKQHKQVVRSIEASIFNLADTYARAWQLGFAQNILQYLPRELRDMVYKKLMSLHNPNENQEVTHRHVDEHHPSALDTTRRFQITGYPHWFDLSFMGTQFLTELSAKFYFDKKFTLKHPKELHDFLYTDRFGTSGLELLKVLAENGFHPTIILRVDCFQNNHGAKFAEVLGNLVYDLKQTGCVLHIEDKYRHRKNAFQFDYSMTKKIWKKAIRENSAFVSYR